LGDTARRLGPDPASSNACTIGGVIANNSGGMRCTVKNDAYQTVSAMTFVMPSGVLVDTSASDAEAAFERTEPDLAIGLLELRGQLLADRELVDRVRRCDTEHPWPPALRSARRRDTTRNLSSSSRRIQGVAPALTAAGQAFAQTPTY
jgi:hypothetical protein